MPLPLRAIWYYHHVVTGLNAAALPSPAPSPNRAPNKTQVLVIIVLTQRNASVSDPGGRTTHVRAVMKRSAPQSGSGAEAGSSTPAPKLKAGGGAGHWSMKLLDSMRNPDLVVRSDPLSVTIKDAYPKAKHHYLVLPHEDIPHLRALKSSHVELLEHMLECGRELAKEQTQKDSSLTFRHGYHASPSMSRVHMHVISQDFISPHLKTKKHWNSFTSGFFIDAETVIKMLRDQGSQSPSRMRTLKPSTTTSCCRMRTFPI